MLTRPMVVTAAVFVSTSLLAQEPATPHSCAASEQALRVVAHRFWAAYNQRDAAALDKLLDDRLLHVTESGNLLSKAEVLAPFRIPQGSMKLESAEEPENVRTVIVDDMAVMSFTKAFKVTHQPTGASFGTTSRMTETFVCAGGEWKVMAFQETMVANRARPVSERPVSRYSSDSCAIDEDASSESSTRSATARSRPGASSDAGRLTAATTAPGSLGVPYLLGAAGEP